MKQKLFIMSTLGTLTALWLASAQAATPSPQFLGTWELDATPAQKTAPDAIPRPVTVTVKDAGGGTWSDQVTLEMADGSLRPQPAVLFTLDGTPSPLTGDLTLTVVFSDPRTAIATVVDHGLPVSTETSTLSADGKHMVHVLDSTDPNGNPIHRTESFHRKT